VPVELDRGHLLSLLHPWYPVTRRSFLLQTGFGYFVGGGCNQVGAPQKSRVPGSDA
jgi:hypothetical protein